MSPSDGEKELKGDKAAADVVERRARPKRGLRFWLVVCAATLASFVAAFDTYAVSTPLPIIAESLNASDNAIWLASANQLTALAFTPLSGNLGDIFGRRAAVLSFLAVFAVGCVLSAVTPNMALMLAGRALQGVGVGGLLSLPVTIISDIVPLVERGKYQAAIAGSWAVGALAGPPIGGALAEVSWRGLFWLNLGLGCLAAVLVALFLNVKVPKDHVYDKLRSIDWFGNAIFVASTTALVVSLTFAGDEYAWSSWHVLLPLVLGLCGLAFFAFYEVKTAKNPMMPKILFASGTANVAYLQAGAQSLLLGFTVFYMLIYFEAVRLKSPSQSGLWLVPALVSAELTAAASGFYVAWRKRYKAVLVSGWPLLLGGSLAFVFLDRTSPLAGAALAELCMGFGLGILADVYVFPILASLRDSHIGAAIAFASTVRAFGNVLLVLGSTILQNQLKMRAPSSYLDMLPKTGDGSPRVAYADLSSITSLPEEQRQAVQDAYASSLADVWWFCAAVSVVGLLASFCTKSLPLREDNDGEHGLVDEAVPVTETG